jgi:Zn-finger nucleic acid-binding protein
MAGTRRVSVVRVPRKFINQINPNDNDDEIDNEPPTSRRKSQHTLRLDDTSMDQKQQNVKRKKKNFFIEITNECL